MASLCEVVFPQHVLLQLVLPRVFSGAHVAPMPPGASMPPSDMPGQVGPTTEVGHRRTTIAAPHDLKRKEQTKKTILSIPHNAAGDGPCECWSVPFGVDFPGRAH